MATPSADRLTGRRRPGDPVVCRPRPSEGAPCPADSPPRSRSSRSPRSSLAACSGGSSAPALTDPTEIVTAALTSTEAAKSVHIDATRRRHLSRRPLGPATRQLRSSSTGTTASADLDIAEQGRPRLVHRPGPVRPLGRAHRRGRKAYLKTSLTGPAVQGQRRRRQTLPASTRPTRARPSTTLGDFLTAAGRRAGQGRRRRLRLEAVLHGERRPDRRGAGGARRRAGQQPAR